MTEARGTYRLRQRLEHQATEWTAATVDGFRLDLVTQFAVEWLALEAQEHALQAARGQLCAEAEQRGVPTETVRVALRHLAAVQGLRTSAAVLHAVLVVCSPLVEGAQ